MGTWGAREVSRIRVLIVCGSYRQRDNKWPNFKSSDRHLYLEYSRDRC